MIDVDPTQSTLASRAGELFRAFRAGDARKIGELVELVTPILWHTARAQRLDREAAEDVVQTAWLTLVRNAESIADPQAVLQWLIVSTRREAWRVVKRTDRVELHETVGDGIAAHQRELPEEMVLRNDTDGRLWQHIALLSEKCQALLRVIAFSDRPDYATVAKALAMPVGSIGPTRGRCLAKLRQQLQEDPKWGAS